MFHRIGCADMVYYGLCYHYLSEWSVIKLQNKIKAYKSVCTLFEYNLLCDGHVQVLINAIIDKFLKLE